MTLGRFSEINLAIDGEISGGVWAAGWPLANLLTEEDYVGSPARCLDATDLAKTQFELVFAEPKVVSLVALFFTTLSIGAKYRISASTLDDPTYATPLLQTAWEWVFPSIYDPIDLEFLSENFWSGTVLQAELDLFKRHLFAAIDEVLADRVRIELDDQENPGGYIDIGGVFLTAGFSPEINFDRGRDLSVSPRDVVDLGVSGRRFTEARDPVRVLSLNYSMLQEPEVRRFVDAALRARSSRTVLFVPNLDDPSGTLREAFPATFGKPPGARFTWPGLHATAFTLEEVIA